MSKLIDHLAAWPDMDHSQFGPVEVKPLGKIQQVTAKFLGRNWVSIPHVTHHDEADITELEAARKAWNAEHPDAKRTMLIPVMQAMAAALRQYPVFNTSLMGDGKSLVWKDFAHIGVAIDTPNGLLVGVVRDVDKRPAAKLIADVTELSNRARSKGLSMADMSGGCMTVSSLGHIGGTAFTPIVNAPEAATLGLSKMQTRAAPAADGGVSWRQILPLSLSYDHRIINGADAARFTVAVADYLKNYHFS